MRTTVLRINSGQGGGVPSWARGAVALVLIVLTYGVGLPESLPAASNNNRAMIEEALITEDSRAASISTSFEPRRTEGTLVFSDRG